MSAFRVDPEVLSDYSKLLSRACDHARECESYFNRRVPELTPGLSGVFNPLAFEHTAVRQKLATILQRLNLLLDSSSGQVAAASRQLGRIDQANAAVIDAAYPRVERPDRRREWRDAPR